MSRTSHKYLYEGVWASKPSAASVAVGSIIRVTDYGGNVGNGSVAGVTTGSEWVSDGTYWRPLNGSVLLYKQNGSFASPVASLTGNGTVQFFTLPVNMAMPAGMLYPGSQLAVFAQVRKNGGTHTGSVLGFLDASPTPANPALSDFSIPTANAGTAGMVKISAQVEIYSGGFMEGGSGGGTAPYTQGSTTTVLVDHPDANILTETRYLGFSIGTSWTDNIASLINYQVSLIG